MVQITCGVICCEGKLPVLHMYRDRGEAASCAKAYQALGIRSLVAELDPPLPSQRAEDWWGVYVEAAQSLRVFPSSVAEGPAAESLLVVHIRQAQPVNSGTPQFAPAPRSFPAGLTCVGAGLTYLGDGLA